MRHLTSLAILTLAAAWPAVAAAQVPWSGLRNPNVTVDYVEPRAPDDPKAADYAKKLATYQSQKRIYDRIKQRQVLEELSAFLAPLRLPRTLRLRTKTCNTVNAYYDPDEWSVNICYEWIEWTQEIAPKLASPDGFTRQEVLVGGLVGVVLHEMGHAVNDILNLPVLGREEDAADQIAGFIMTQFGKDVARTTIKGTAYLWLTWSRRDPPVYWDVHSTDGQRFYNFLCIGYGGDPEAFKDFVDKLIPKERLEPCAHEFRQVRNAFIKTVMPHVDQDLLKKVQATQWMRPDDGKWD
jgi:Putative metallopeptidase